EDVMSGRGALPFARSRLSPCVRCRVSACLLACAVWTGRSAATSRFGRFLFVRIQLFVSRLARRVSVSPARQLPTRSGRDVVVPVPTDTWSALVAHGHHRRRHARTVVHRSLRRPLFQSHSSFSRL